MHFQSHAGTSTYTTPTVGMDIALINTSSQHRGVWTTLVCESCPNTNKKEKNSSLATQQGDGCIKGIVFV